MDCLLYPKNKKSTFLYDNAYLTPYYSIYKAKSPYEVIIKKNIRAIKIEENE